MARTVIGGLAVQRWGEPRQIRDVDVALLTGLGTEAAFVDSLLEKEDLTSEAMLRKLLRKHL